MCRQNRDNFRSGYSCTGKTSPFFVILFIIGALVFSKTVFAATFSFTPVALIIGILFLINTLQRVQSSWMDDTWEQQEVEKEAERLRRNHERLQKQWKNSDFV